MKTIKLSCRSGKNKTKHDIKKVIKYYVQDKNTKNVHLFRYKTQISNFIGISVRTLDRKMPYECEKYVVGS